MFIFFRCWLIIFVGFPLKEGAGVELSLLIAIIFDANSFIHYPIGAIVSFVSVLAVFFAQTQIIAWNIEVPAMPIKDRIGMLLYSLVLIFVLSFTESKVLTLLKKKARADRAHQANLELANINLALQQHSMNAENKARTSERVRISEALHDTVGYALTNQRMMMEAAIRQCSIEQGELYSLLEQARSQAQESLREMKTAMRELRDVDRSLGYRIDDLIKLVKAFEKTSTSVSIDFRNIEGSVHPVIDQIIFRIVQEGITNAIQHGTASEIQISMWQGDREISVSVSDNGIGCDEIIEGVGLKGMRERIEAVGGSIKTANIPGGFILYARIPFQA